MRKHKVFFLALHPRYPSFEASVPCRVSEVSVIPFESGRMKHAQGFVVGFFGSIRLSRVNEAASFPRTSCVDLRFLASLHGERASFDDGKVVEGAQWLIASPPCAAPPAQCSPPYWPLRSGDKSRTPTQCRRRRNRRTISARSPVRVRWAWGTRSTRLEYRRPLSI